MMQLHQDHREFAKRNTELVAIGPDSGDKFKNFWEKNQIDFYGLPDEEHRILDLYGQEVNMLKLGRMPAQILVDMEGNLRYIHFGRSAKDIPKNKEILDLIDRL